MSQIVTVRLTLPEARALLRATRYSTDTPLDARRALFPRRRERQACARAENRLRAAVKATRAEAKR